MGHLLLADRTAVQLQRMYSFLSNQSFPKTILSCSFDAINTNGDRIFTFTVWTTAIRFPFHNEFVNYLLIYKMSKWQSQDKSHKLSISRTFPIKK